MTKAEYWEADFTVRPNLFTPQDLAPLIEHPDIQVGSASEEEYIYIVKSMTTLGKVALAHEDIGAYRGWMERASAFVEAIQQPDIEEPTQYYRDINELLFAGAAHGDFEAYEQLQQAIRGPEGANALLAVVKQCAQKDISPFSWIEQATSDVDMQADAWGEYVYTRSLLLQEAGQAIIAESLHTPGIERFLDSAISGRLSPYVRVIWGSQAYKLCRDSAEKQELIASYEMALNELLIFHPFEAGELMENVMTFAARINSDPDIPHATKTTLTARVRIGLAETTEISAEHRVAFELSAGIANGEGLRELVDRIDGAILLVNNTFSKGQIHDHLSRTASELLASQGQLTEAAVMVSRITNIEQWRSALEHYIQAGGNVDLVRRSDEMRKLYDNAPVPSIPVVRAPAWETRQHVMNFLEALSLDVPAIGQAESAILAMAEALGDNRKDCPAAFMFNSYIARLLAVSKTSVKIGPQVEQHLREARYADNDSVRRLFSAHGSTELAQIGWDHLDTRLGAPQYFMQYASMALAAAGVVDQ